YLKVLAMAQIKGIIDQTHRNHELDQIKKIYHGNASTLLYQNQQNNQVNSNEVEQTNTVDKNRENKIDILELDEIRINNNKTEDERFDDDWKNGEEKSVAKALSDLDISPNIFLHNQRHPQRDENAK
ncbi:5772_t:CDS:2, partial [Racocetra persica]